MIHNLCVCCDGYFKFNCIIVIFFCSKNGIFFCILPVFCYKLTSVAQHTNIFICIKIHFTSCAFKSISFQWDVKCEVILTYIRSFHSVHQFFSLSSLYCLPLNVFSPFRMDGPFASKCNWMQYLNLSNGFTWVANHRIIKKNQFNWMVSIHVKSESRIFSTFLNGIHFHSCTFTHSFLVFKECLVSVAKLLIFIPNILI